MVYYGDYRVFIGIIGIIGGFYRGSIGYIMVHYTDYRGFLWG